MLAQVYVERKQTTQPNLSRHEKHTAPGKPSPRRKTSRINGAVAPNRFDAPLSPCLELLPAIILIFAWTPCVTTREVLHVSVAFRTTPWEGTVKKQKRTGVAHTYSRAVNLRASFWFTISRLARHYCQTCVGLSSCALQLS